MNNTTAGAIGVALAILLSLAGLAVSGALLVRHAELATGQDLLTAGPACGGSDRWSCDEVIQSDWGHFPFGRDGAGWRIPTAMLGLFYFAATAAWFLVIGRPSGTRAPWHWLAALITLGGAAVAGYLDYVMWVKVPAAGGFGTFGAGMPGSAGAAAMSICPLCLTTHILAGLLLVVTWLLWPRRRQQAILASPAGGAPGEPVRVYAPQVDHPTARALLAFLMAAAAIGSAGFFAYRWAEGRAAQKKVVALLKEYEDDYQAVYFNYVSEPYLYIPVTPDDSIRGAPHAPNTIVMFTDLQCPFCRTADQIVKEKVAKYPDRLRLVVKHFPLDKICNRHVKGSTHAGACATAVTVEAARAVGGDEAFWKMYDELFKHQAEFRKKGRAQSLVKEISDRIGIDNDALWKKINTSATWNRVREHADQGHDAEVDSTPTLFFNGRRVNAWANSRFWDYLMRLDEAGKLPPIPAGTGPAGTQPAAESRPATHTATADE